MPDDITDADRWAYVRDRLVRVQSAKMDNQHYWSFRQFRSCGATFEEAVDRAIRSEREATEE